MDSRRNELNRATLQSTTHAGLWLDRFVCKLRDRTQSEGGVGQEHIQELCKQVTVPAEYRRHYQRWERQLKETRGTLTAKAEVHGRMVVGLGTESVLETAITLHRTYGVPVIPGSALKGLASTAAHRFLEGPAWRRRAPDGGATTKEPNSHAIVFGTTESAGYITFHDALWIPDSDRVPLDPDVMTVHHRDYYAGENAPAADWDNPTPVPFVTARGIYLVAVTGPDEWADAAMQILKEALRMDGIGAKTAAGYGRLALHYESAAERKAQALREVQEREEQAKRAAQERAARTETLMKRARQVKPNTAEAEVPRLLKEVDPAARGTLAKAIVSVLKQSWLQKRNDKPWVQELLEAAGMNP